MIFRLLSLFFCSLFFSSVAYAAVPSDMYSNPVLSVRYDHDNRYEHLWHSTGVFINAEGYVLAAASVLENSGTLIGCVASENAEEAGDNCIYTFRLIATDKLNGLLLLQVSKVLVDEKWYTAKEYRKKFSDFPTPSFGKCDSFLKNSEVNVHLYDWKYTANEDDSCYAHGYIEKCYNMPFYKEDASFLKKYTETGKNGVDKFTKHHFSLTNGEPRYTLGAILMDSNNTVVGFHDKKTLSTAVGFANMESILAFLDTKKISYTTAETNICEENNKFEFPRDATEEELERDVTKSVIHVESRYRDTNTVYAFGSGFFVGDDYHIITNNHVVGLSLEEEKINLRGCIQNETNTQLDCPFVLKVVDVDTENDLALLKVKEVFNGNSVRKRTLAEYLRRSPGRISSLSLGNIRLAKKGEDITTYGFPSIDDGHWEKDKLPLQLTTGDVYHVWGNIFKVNARVVGGISGGPTFAEDNSLVGVVYAYPTAEPEKSLHITATKLLDFLKKNNILVEEKTPIIEKKPVQKNEQETHVLKKSFKKIIVAGVISCNKEHTEKPLRKQCIKEKIVDFIKEKNTEKRQLTKECHAENIKDIGLCVQEKIEAL